MDVYSLLIDMYSHEMKPPCQPPGLARLLPSDWLFPVPTLFGAGRAAEISSLLTRKRCARPMLVTDEALVQTGLPARLMHGLREAGLAPYLFSGVQSDPTDQNVATGCSLFRAHHADSVIALGGGSGIDAGKAIAITAVSGLSLDDCKYFGGSPPVVSSSVMPPVIAVPTTAGTGAEMDSACVIMNEIKHEKDTYAHEQLALSVVLDPELTLSLPSHLTAYTGMDALTHAFEAYSVKDFHPMVRRRCSDRAQ